MNHTHTHTHMHERTRIAMNNYQDTAGNYNAWNCNRYGVIQLIYYNLLGRIEWLSRRVVSVLDSDAKGLGSNRSRDAVR